MPELMQTNHNPADTPPISPWQRRASSVWTLLLNLVLLAIYFRDATLIRSDGPNGWGESILKGLILLFSLNFFCISLIASGVMHWRAKPRPILTRICIFTTIWLALFAMMAIVDACSDAKGYCRGWSLYFS